MIDALPAPPPVGYGGSEANRNAISDTHKVLTIFNGAPTGLVSGSDLFPAPDISTVSINMAENTGNPALVDVVLQIVAAPSGSTLCSLNLEFLVDRAVCRAQGQIMVPYYLNHDAPLIICCIPPRII
jgi:hypothetical protein